MFGNGSQIVPRCLTVGFEFFYFPAYLVPVGLGASTEAAQIGMQIGRVLALFQYDRTQMLQQ